MRRLAIAPLLLAAAACGSDAATVGAPTAVTTATTTPATPRATTPAAAKPTARPTTPPAQPPVARPTTAPPAPPAAKPTQAPPAPAKPAQPAAKAGDVDGDGRADTVRVVERKNSLATGVWDLRVSLGSGGTVVTGVVTAEPQVRPTVLGVVDADRDGDGEVFLRVGGGASTTSYTPYTLVEDGMAEVRTVDGKPLRLVVGGSVTHGDGFACADLPGTAGRELLTLSVVADDSGETFRGTRVTYRWRDDQVVELSRKAFSGKQGDPAVEAAYEIDCDGLG